MGLCVSRGATAEAETAKLILDDGGLREFAEPVKASHAMGKADPAWFVCDADVMEFDGLVSAVGADDELRPGQIYFVLPESMLRHPLQPEDLAALAVKASAALVRAAGKGRIRRRAISPHPLVFAEARPTSASTVPPARRQRKDGGGGRGRNFLSSLSAIPE